MGTVTDYAIGQEVPPVRKQIAQERITLFERSGGYAAPTIHTDAEAAKKSTGVASLMASGRMSLSFATECLRRFFGEDVYNRSGMVDLRFLRPVRDGDTLTVTGKVSSIVAEANGRRVTIELSIHNQHSDTTAAGQGAAVVPSGFFPSE
jgi:3-hydroxybutyryl-CoA dehydratase